MPSDLTGVRERVKAMATLWEARARFVGMANTLDAEASDLRALLAALATPQPETPDV